MKKLRRLVLAFIVLSWLAVTLAPEPVGAHPMGNFSINQYSALALSVDRVDILYIVDMAEIPAFSELGTIRDDRSTDLTEEQSSNYIARKVTELLPGLVLRVNGQSVLMQVQSSSLTFPPGQFNSPTLRLELSLRGDIQVGSKATLE